MSNLDRAYRMTRFKKMSAQSKKDLTLSLHDLDKMILETTGEAKEKLPWIKQAVFGDERTPLRELSDGRRTGNSLRHDANVLKVTGVEADYDLEVMSIDEAADICRKAEICALLYSTPSSTPEKPRWRIICPFSEEHDPPERRAFMARLNGLFNGIFDQGCFDLSRSFYYGNVEGKPPIETILVDGRYLDEADDLDHIALDKRGRSATALTGEEHEEEPADLTFEEVKAALMSIPNDGTKPEHGERDWWIGIIAALHHQTQGEGEGLELAWEWTQQFDPRQESFDHLEQTWDSLRTRRAGNIRTFEYIAHLARENGWEDPRIRESFDDITEEMKKERADALGVDPADLEDEEAESIFEIVMKEMNARHARVDMEGKTRIMNFKASGKETFSAVRDFKDAYTETIIQVGTTAKGDPKYATYAEFWLKNKDLRQYPEGLVFMPGLKPPHGAYNLWKGFAVKPDPSASCEFFLDHTLNNICSGNQERFDYLMNWLAHMIQKPWEKPDVAVVFGGIKGIGKDSFGQYVGAMLRRRNYVVVQSRKQLTGDFNAHQAEALLLHAEDAFWVGDQAAIGVLNGLITSSVAMIERKGIDSIQVPSYLRLLISSNSEGIVPATWDERRYYVEDVKDTRKGDEDYWNAYWAEKRGSGPAALLALLQARDISGFEPRKVPQTAGLARQKEAYLRGADAFIRAILLEGEWPSRAGTEGFDDSSPDWKVGDAIVNKDALWGEYVDWMRARPGVGHGAILEKTAFGMKLSKMFPSKGSTDLGRGSKRAKLHVFPRLDVCRREFETYLKVERLDWPEDENDLI